MKKEHLLFLSIEEADEHFVFFFQPKRDPHRKISERNSPEEHRESDWKRKASGKILQRISARVACAPKKFRREEGEESVAMETLTAGLRKLQANGIGAAQDQ
ncbi:hypothetical protein CDAR_557601 [Caerostris darwini]|uniref:Uncharacterized protein n=1 Tax=Caerostris darwini TaxID=1538125 RepID=A0AAV4TFV7_9ARAC|nr:hypothetical protein CDAR_557601 [Caerostris darwini]